MLAGVWGADPVQLHVIEEIQVAESLCIDLNYTHGRIYGYG